MRQTSHARQAQREWPRDFDFRADYAEQQELLAADGAAVATPAEEQDHDD